MLYHSKLYKQQNIYKHWGQMQLQQVDHTWTAAGSARQQVSRQDTVAVLALVQLSDLSHVNGIWQFVHHQ